jgi:hypothetical protein
VFAVTWISSSYVFILLMVAPVVGSMCDAGHTWHFVCNGTALINIGSFICSSFFGNTHAATLFLQRVLTGVGLGCLFTPAMTVPPAYFVRLRAFGVAAAGVCFGGVLHLMIVRIILDRCGYGWGLSTLMFLVRLT